MRSFAYSMRLATLLLLMGNNTSSQADLDDFVEGAAITEFGKYADVATHSIKNTMVFNVAFDVAQAGDVGKINRKFDSLARFINMHSAAGVSKEHIQLALVVHGKASLDLLDHATYQKANNVDNANKALIEALLANNVQVILCGQTAAAYDIALPQLIKGVQIELSAMTAHAVLQQQGYTLNPF